MPALGWEVSFFHDDEMDARLLATIKLCDNSWLEDMKTGEVLHNSCDLPRVMHIATTQWTDRERFKEELRGE